MNKIEEMIQQNKEKKIQQNLIYQQKLTQLINNNNLLIHELKKLEETVTNSEERLQALRNDLDYVENLYSDLFDFLSNSYDQLKSIKEELKAKKNSNKKTTTKKPIKPKKSKNIREATMEEEVLKFKSMINYLITQYASHKTANK